MLRDNLEARITSRWSFCAGLSRALAFLLATSLCASAQQAVTLQIRAVESKQLQQSITNSNQQKLIIVVEDSLGVPIPMATVSFRLPDSGVFENGLRTEIATTGTDGRAASSVIRWSVAGGSVPVRITAALGEQRAGAVLNVNVTTAHLTARSTPDIAVTQPLPAPAAAPERITAPKPIALGALIAPNPPAPTPPDLQTPRYEPPGFWRSKWFLVAVSAGGALTAGYFAARGRSSPTAAPVSPITPGGITQIPVVIGVPTVTIGKP